MSIEFLEIVRKIIYIINYLYMDLLIYIIYIYIYRSTSTSPFFWPTGLRPLDLNVNELYLLQGTTAVPGRSDDGGSDDGASVQSLGRLGRDRRFGEPEKITMFNG